MVSENHLNEEIDLIDCIKTLWKYKIWIMSAFFVTVFIAMVYSKMLPETFRADTIVLSSADPGDIRASGMLRAAGIRGTARTNPLDTFVGILKSRTMLEDIIEEFSLMEYYQAEYRQNVRDVVRNNTSVEISDEQMIVIRYSDTDPQRAADVANFYAENLDRLNKLLNVTAARQAREFIERRLDDTIAELRKAEDDLEKFRQKHKVAGVGDSAGAAGGLQGRLVAKRVEREAKRRFTGQDNPDIRKLDAEIQELERALEEMPPVDTEMGRLVRELKKHEAVYQLLEQQYRQSQIEEARDTPTVQILDEAIVPERKYAPSVRKNMMLAGIASLFLSTLAVFAYEFVFTKIKPN